MSCCQVNKCCAKSFIVFVAVVILLQGCIYLGLSLWGLLHEACRGSTQNCWTRMEGLSLDFLFDLIYFLNEKVMLAIKEDPNSANYSNLTLNVTFEPERKMLIDRTYGIMVSYGAISALWIVLSLIVITSGCVPLTKSVARFYFWPWFIAIMMGSFLDVVATVYHIWDIIGTSSSEKALKYINAVITPPGSENLFQGMDIFLLIPAIVMTCLTSRFVILWIFNICGSAFCLTLSQVLISDCKTTKVKRRKNSNESCHQKDQPPCDKGHVNANFQSSEEHLSYANNFVTTQDRNGTPNTAASTSSLLEGREHTSDQKEAISYRNIETHPDRLDYPANLHPSCACPQSNLSSLTPLNTRYMSNAGAKSKNVNREGIMSLKASAPCDEDFRSVNNRESMAAISAPKRTSTTLHPSMLTPTDEIRSHLPWSYTNASSKATSKVRSEQWGYSAPHIPAPDYDTESLK